MKTVHPIFPSHEALAATSSGSPAMPKMNGDEPRLQSHVGYGSCAISSKRKSLLLSIPPPHWVKAPLQIRSHSGFFRRLFSVVGEVPTCDCTYVQVSR
ncbi:hypothetical protein ANCCAN_20512 [Ancylostoma caninum]|uniref:Uncharacterized protein n=1 Tax=Ancylostoma caninum TaxID=29170 RepID=A0A368FN49_ANCCA|nr:hypothetical protein ANCCAN_20512 [Ancylostoma caninum]